MSSDDRSRLAKVGQGEVEQRLAGGTRVSLQESQNRLEYLADMISELQLMAADCAGSTLQGLLGLSYAEARLNIKRLRQQVAEVGQEALGTPGKDSV